MYLEIKENLKKYEASLRNLKKDRSGKEQASIIYSKLNQLETMLVNKSNNQEVQEILNEIDSLKHIASSMIEYYLEPMC